MSISASKVGLLYPKEASSAMITMYPDVSTSQSVNPCFSQIHKKNIVFLLTHFTWFTLSHPFRGCILALLHHDLGESWNPIFNPFDRESWCIVVHCSVICGRYSDIYMTSQYIQYITCICYNMCISMYFHIGKYLYIVFL